MKVITYRKSIVIILAVFLVSIIPVIGSAQVPQTINYQGYLTDSLGDPVDTAGGTIGMQFDIYDGVTNIWSSGIMAVTVNQGVYSVTFSGLGSLPFSTQYDLEVAVDEDSSASIEPSEILSPRQPFTAVPYALNADRIDGMDSSELGDITAVNPGTGLSGGGAAGDVTLSANTTYLQRRVTGSCAAGQSIRVISATGTVTCEPDDGILVETDPVFGASASSGITAGNITNWNTAFSWGNHAGAGYDTTNDSWIGTGNITMTTGNVSIGTDVSSSYKLDVQATGFYPLRAESSAGETIMALKNTSTNGRDWWLLSGGSSGAASGGKFAIFDATAFGARFTINSTGNVGIGTTTPLYKLHIEGGSVNVNDSDWSRKAVLGGSGTGVYGSGSVRGGYFITNGTAGAYGITALDGGAAGAAYLSGDVHVVSSTISDGKVGIGTTSPTARLEVSGPTAYLKLVNPTVNAADAGKLIFAEGTIEAMELGYDGSADMLHLDTLTIPNALTVKRTTGNVGIGTGSPAQKLHVAGNFIRVDGAGNEQAYIGGDGAGADVQIGSSNAAITGVALWNTATASRMDLWVRALHISGGADLAEPFEAMDSNKLEPGMLVVIDPENPGQLKLSKGAYDRTVAGVVSGANGITPGVTMKQEGTDADGTIPVALSGRVYAWADASHGAIEPGDLLTTSDTPGHAMKVADHEKANGTIIGKAMTSLKEGRGLVLVLVSLQ